MHTELCLEWPNKMTDKPYEAVVGVFYALFFIWQTSDCQLPYFSFEKMYKFDQILPAVPTWFQWWK